MATQSDIRDMFIENVGKLAEKVSTDKSLALTQREKEVLKALPKTVLRQVEKILSKYQPMNSKYDIRKELVLKAVAQLALHAKLMHEAYGIGSDAGDAYNG